MGGGGGDRVCARGGALPAGVTFGRRNLLNLEDEELGELVKMFDKDGDGSISMMEFKHYCYNIKSLCWKAERVRLEAAGEFVGFAESPVSAAAVPDGQAPRRPPNSSARAPDISLLHECTKLFWRTGEKIELMIFECAAYKLLVVARYATPVSKRLVTLGARI